MDHIFEHYKKTGYLHHAHVVEGVYDEVFPVIVSALGRHVGVETKNNPDLTTEYFDLFGVDEARVLKNAQTRSAFNGGRKFFIVGAKSFTHEAQNALLKTFEEPTDGTHFFIILPNTEILLPTLRSRVLIVQSKTKNTEDEAKTIAEKFIDSSLEDRFAMIKKLTEKKSGEVVDKELFRRILDHIERILYTRTAGKRDENTTNIFHQIYQTKKYLSDRGASPKMLMEHIAIVLV